MPRRRDPSVLDDAAAREVRAAERRRIAALLPRAIADAVPAEPEAYIQGFKDGAAFVAERVLGETLPLDDLPQPT